MIIHLAIAGHAKQKRWLPLKRVANIIKRSNKNQERGNHETQIRYPKNKDEYFLAVFGRVVGGSYYRFAATNAVGKYPRNPTKTGHDGNIKIIFDFPFNLFYAFLTRGETL